MRLAVGQIKFGIQPFLTSLLLGEGLKIVESIWSYLHVQKIAFSWSTSYAAWHVQHTYGNRDSVLHSWRFGRKEQTFQLISGYLPVPLCNWQVQLIYLQGVDMSEAAHPDRLVAWGGRRSRGCRHSISARIIRISNLERRSKRVGHWILVSIKERTKTWPNVIPQCIRKQHHIGCRNMSVSFFKLRLLMWNNPSLLLDQ